MNHPFNFHQNWITESRFKIDRLKDAMNNNTSTTTTKEGIPVLPQNTSTQTVYWLFLGEPRGWIYTSPTEGRHYWEKLSKTHQQCRFVFYCLPWPDRSRYNHRFHLLPVVGRLMTSFFKGLP